MNFLHPGLYRKWIRLAIFTEILRNDHMRIISGYLAYAMLIVFLLKCIRMESQVTSPEKSESYNTRSNYIPTSTNTVKMGEREIPVLSPQADEVFRKLDASDFLELYKSIHNNSTRNNRYNIPEQNRKELNLVLEKLESAFPDSYEYHYAAWLNSSMDTAMAHHLLKAARLAPEKTEIYTDLVAYYELKSDITGKRDWCAKIDRKKMYDPVLYHYAKNLLKSVEQGGYIFTQGEWDTYPLWVLQNIHKERPDVTVLQLELLHKQYYFNRMMEPFRLKKNAYRLFLTDKSGFFRELAAGSGRNNKVYLSLTIDRHILQDVSDILYNTGLAMKLTSNPFDNISILEDNWKRFDLTLTGSQVKNSDLNRMNGNYIMPIGILYKRAVVNKRTAEAEDLRQKMLNIARQAGMLKEMEEYLKTTP